MNKNQTSHKLSDECLEAVLDRIELSGLIPDKGEGARRLLWAIDAYVAWCERKEKDEK